MAREKRNWMVFNIIIIIVSVDSNGSVCISEAISRPGDFFDFFFSVVFVLIRSSGFSMFGIPMTPNEIQKTNKEKQVQNYLQHHATIGSRLYNFSSP